MKINIKSDKEVEIMKRAGKILGDVLYETVEAVKPGITELELDKLAEKRIREEGGESGFKKVPGYVHTICSSTNDVVVHGIPKKRVLNKGDIIGIDCGVFIDGFHTDMAETVRVGGSQGDKVDEFLATGKRALYEAIKQVKPGNRVGHISKTLQQIIEKEGGYSVVRGLVGHGVGRELHEDPEIPGYFSGKLEKTPELVPNMTIAIEIIYNMGSQDVIYDSNDGWTIASSDGSLSAVFERSILVTETGFELLTAFPGEKSK